MPILKLSCGRGTRDSREKSFLGSACMPSGNYDLWIKAILTQSVACLVERLITQDDPPTMASPAGGVRSFLLRVAPFRSRSGQGQPGALETTLAGLQLRVECQRHLVVKKCKIIKRGIP